MGATVRRPHRLATFLLVAVFVGTLLPTATRAGVHVSAPGPAAPPQSEVLRGPSPLDSQWQALQAAAPAGEPDTDADGIKDSVERVLGIDPGERDSDFDGLLDRAELLAGMDPRLPDSNLDGLSDGAEVGADGVTDVDGDGIANAWDDDNDGDGVPDQADLSPLAGPTEDEPGDSVRIDYAGNGRSTTLDLQVVPEDPSHLRLAGAKWDWPADTTGQMQDNDASREDVTLLPLLEIVPSDMTGLRAAAEQLEDQYGIVVAPEDATAPDFVVERIELGNLDGQADGLDLRLVGRGSSSLTGVQSVTVERGYSCATVVAPGAADGDPDRGEVWCWGARESLGAGNVAQDSAEPWPVALDLSGYGKAGWAKVDEATSAVPAGWVATGSGHACMVVRLETGTDKVWCWGDNSYGQIRAPSSPNPLARYTVTTAAGLDRMTVRYSKSGGLVVNRVDGLAVGDRHSCAWARYRFVIETAPYTYDRDELTCWGDNSEGQLGQGYAGGPALTTAVPVLLRGAIVGTGPWYLARDLAGSRQTISAGSLHTCAIVSLKPAATQGPADRRVACWGDGRNGQLGIGAGTTELVVVGLVDDPAVSGDTIPVALSSDRDRTCVLTQAGTVQCWGDRLAVGDAAAAAPRTVYSGGDPADGIEVGDGSLCIHTTVGDVRCGGSTLGSTYPVTLGEGDGVTSFSTSGGGMCTVAHGVVSCSGANDRRQAGSENTAVAVATPTPIDERELVMTGTDLATWPGGPGPAADWSRATECVSHRELVGGAKEGRSSACVAPVLPRGISGTIPATHRSVARIDIDGDGVSEYVASGIDEKTGRLRYQVGDPNLAGRLPPIRWGVVRESTPLPLGAAGGGAAVADVDADGVLDLVYLAVDDAATHRFHYLVGRHLSPQGAVQSWSGVERLPGGSNADRLYVPLAPSRTADGTVRAFTGRVPLPATLGTSALTLDARLVWAVQGRSDHPDIDRTILLVRYGEPFTLTGLAAVEHNGTDVAAFSPTVADPDRRLGLAAALSVALGERFLKEGRSVDRLAADLAAYDLPLTEWERRTAKNTGSTPIPDENAGFAALDAMTDEILAAVPTASLVPVWVGVENRVRSVGLSDLSAQPGRVYRVRLGDRPVASVKTAKLNFYDTTGDAPETVVGEWARSLEAYDLGAARAATLALLGTWSTGQTRLASVGGVPVAMATNADSVALEVVTWLANGISKAPKVYGLMTGRLSEVKGAIKDFNRLAPWVDSLAGIPDRTLIRVRAVIGATDDSARAASMLNKHIGLEWSRSKNLDALGTLGDTAFAFYTFFSTWANYGWNMYGAIVALTGLVIDLSLIVAGLAVACLADPLAWIPAALAVATAWIFGWQDDLAEWMARIIVGVEDPVAKAVPSLGGSHEEIDDVDGNGIDVGDHLGFAGDFYPREHGLWEGSTGVISATAAEALDYTVVYDARLFWTPPSEPHPRLGQGEILENYGGWKVWTFPVQYRRPLAASITPTEASTNLAASFGLHWLAAIQTWYCQVDCQWLLTEVGSTVEESGGNFRREQGDLVEMHYDVMPGDLAGFLSWNALTALDADHDGRPNATDDSAVWDADGDGISDGVEIEQETDPHARDSDGDGVPDGCADGDAGCVVSEVLLRTDPADPDTDDDGLTDGEEVEGWDVTIAYRGLHLAVRVTSDPTLPNSDDDALGDGNEAGEGMNPRSRDTDGDGIDDPEWGVERIATGDDAAQVVDVSADGRYVVFDSARRLVAADTDSFLDVYRFDRNTRTLALVSGLAAYGENASQPSVSDDGRFVASRVEYYTGATGLVYRAIVVHDMVARTSAAVNASIRCAPDGAGVPAGHAALCADLATFVVGADVSAPAISGNGRYVAYVVHDTGTPRQVLVFDRQARTTRIASMAPDGGGPHPECEDYGGYLSSASIDPTLSDDGSVIAFTAECEGPYVVALDLPTGEMVDVRPAPGVPAAQPDVSGDGRFVALVSGGSSSADEGEIQVYDRDLETFVDLGLTGRVPSVDEHAGVVVFQSSRSTADGPRAMILRANPGVPQVAVLSAPLIGPAPDGDSAAPVVSDDGSVAAWSSLAANLFAGDVNGAWDVFVRVLD